MKGEFKVESFEFQQGIVHWSNYLIIDRIH